MSLVLELYQNEHRQMVGVFESKEELLAFLCAIPFVEQRNDAYYLPFSALPECYELHHNGWIHILSRSSFSSYPHDGNIQFLWQEVQNFSLPCPTPPTFSSSSIEVNGYTYPVADAAVYIQEREALYAHCLDYCKTTGQVAARAALGSQDGEYVEIGEHLAFLLDGAATELHKKCANFEEFLRRYEAGEPFS